MNLRTEEYRNPTIHPFVGSSVREFSYESKSLSKKNLQEMQDCSAKRPDLCDL